MNIFLLKIFKLVYESRLLILSVIFAKFANLFLKGRQCSSLLKSEKCGRNAFSGRLQAFIAFCLVVETVC